MGNKKHLKNIPSLTYAERVIPFLKNLSLKIPASKGIAVLNPYQEKNIFNCCKIFYKKYYSDTQTRTLLVGINPGRFGGGLTGIPFTDPIKLEDTCAIKNNLPKRAEMSGNFMYKMIDAYGGVDAFYKNFYFSSISPLGFTYEGKNLNYYDMKWLRQKVYPFAVKAMQDQLKFGLNTHVAFCIGTGKNFDFFTALNQEFNFFETIVPLPHPRFIMQYNRRKTAEHIDNYIEKLQQLY